MDIAVLSDIHSNCIALQTCIDYIKNRGIHTFIFLGDYIGELAYPKKTMDTLYSLNEKYNCFFIKGNKEDYWLNYQNNGRKEWSEFSSTTGSLYYAYHNLRKKDLDFFKSLSYKGEIKLEGLLPITVCHGSPQKVNEKLLSGAEKTFAIMENNPNKYILCGHTHIQGKIEKNDKLVLNAGSVGIPLHSKGKSQFMILHGTQGMWNPEFISLDYDVEKAVADLYFSGLSEKAPYWCKVSENLLRTGEISHGTVLAKAMELCTEKFGICIWPNIPEECWECAVKEIIDCYTGSHYPPIFS